MPTNSPMFDFVDDNQRGPSKGWVGNMEKLSKPINEGFRQEAQLSMCDVNSVRQGKFA